MKYQGSEYACSALGTHFSHIKQMLLGIKRDSVRVHKKWRATRGYYFGWHLVSPEGEGSSSGNGRGHFKTLYGCRMAAIQHEKNGERMVKAKRRKFRPGRV